MPVQILMPALSPTMTEGNLVKWLKSEGDSVKAGEILAEIETDKATMEVEAVDEGVLARIVVPGGSEGVQVNALIALLLEEGEDAASLDAVMTTPSVVPGSITGLAENGGVSMEKPAEKSLTTTNLEAAHEEGRVFVSPLARRVATQNQINIHQLQGTGPKGRIIHADVLAAMQHPLKNVSVATPSKTSAPVYGDAAYVDQPLNNMRKVIAKRLTQAKQEVPHFYLTIDCRLDALMTLRKDINRRLEGQKVSVNDFIVRACALSLMKVPEANAAWLGDVIRLYQAADVCVAVAIGGGLVTPIVRHAHAKSLKEISAEVKTLAEKARAGKLMPEDYQGGGFTISNLGMYGIKNFSAILNPPQACILAVGAGEQRAIVVDGAIEIATVMTCTLSVDHRAVDGAIGARFLAAFKELIEDPLSLLV